MIKYDAYNKIGAFQTRDYDWEIVDGMPRYRWYKYAKNAVFMIQGCDANHDIKDDDFSDFEIYYNGAEWVAKNDPDALVAIMGSTIEPVHQIVKDRLVEYLIEFECFKACAIVTEHLRTVPVPELRTFNRKWEKAMQDVKDEILAPMKSSSDQLYKTKTEEKYKLFQPKLQDAFGVILDFIGVNTQRVENALHSLNWLFLNSPTDIERLFVNPVCAEVKDLLLQFIIEMELYELHVFMDRVIKVHTMDFYYKIPPYPPHEYDDGYGD